MKITLPVLASLGLLIADRGAAADSARAVWQPVLEFLAREPMASQRTNADNTEVLTINPFVAYTHLGTDFGFHGPGEKSIGWEDHKIKLSLGGSAAWAGMWYSLAGQASSSSEVMDFAQCYPALIEPRVQPYISALAVQAQGKGRIKLEIKGADQALLWEDNTDVTAGGASRPELAVNASDLRQAKFLNWTAEPGSDLTISSVRMKVEMPAMEFDRYVLLASYAKMARCYTPGHGLLQDRAHVPAGSFDSVTASGMFALATAVASQPEVAIVEPAKARQVLHDVEAAIAAIPKGLGLLPHFVVCGKDGKERIHRGTEFSTVDTALAYHGLLLAAEMLGDEEVKARVLVAIKAIDFASLTLADGSISHGARDDGHTVIPFSWKDWGGETALVMLMARLGGVKPDVGAMQHSGHPWQGTGFIAEVQSLFYPDFDSITPDNVCKVNWHSARRNLLAAQKDYFPTQQPQCQVARLGVYGLSAGEGAFGKSYSVGGVDLKGQDLVHPHYILMSGALEDDPQTVYAVLRNMEKQGWLTPWGLVETITADGSRYLPMISSLNAGFETIGAYNLLAKSRHIDNAIYKASEHSNELRDAVKLFYPTPSSTSASLK